MFDPNQLDNTINNLNQSVSEITKISYLLSQIKSLINELNDRINNLDSKSITLSNESMKIIQEDFEEIFTKQLINNKEDLNKTESTILAEIKRVEDSLYIQQTQNFEKLNDKTKELHSDQSALINTINFISEREQTNNTSTSYGIGEIKGQITANHDEIRSLRQSLENELFSLKRRNNAHNTVVIVLSIIIIALLIFIAYLIYFRILPGR